MSAVAARGVGTSLEVLLVDLGGDAPAALGLAEPVGPGLAEWLHSPGCMPLDSLVRDTGVGLGLVPRGDSAFTDRPERWLDLADELVATGAHVVVDAGTAPFAASAVEALTDRADASLLVVRPCYLALRRVASSRVRRTGVVLVGEPGRALSATDVASVVGVDVQAEVALDPSVARAVDAGLLACRLPRSLGLALARITPP